MGIKVEINTGKKNNSPHKQYSVTDNIVYAKKIGMLSSNDAREIIDSFTELRILNSNKAAKKLSEIIKLYKSGVYDHLDALSAISEIYVTMDRER